MQIATPATPVLDPELRRTTAVLDAPNPAAPGGTTRVYVLAMSHVSAKSCDQVRELIRAIRPDIIMVELCKDRLGLLATEFPPGPRVWHCPNVKVTGLLEGSGFPTADELKSLLTCKPGRPFSAADIEDDVNALQATGLFKSVRPAATSGTEQDAPMFILSEEEDGELRVDTVPPFAELDFRCQTRSLPELTELKVRVSSKAVAAGINIPAPRLQSIHDATLKAVKHDGTRTVAALMGMRARIQAEVSDAVAVTVEFEGVENGRVEAIVRLRKPGGGLHTGLEGSAVMGKGFGIEVFQSPNQQGDGVPIGLTSSVPPAVIEHLAHKAAVATRGNGAVPPEVEGRAESAGPVLGRLVKLEGGVARGRGVTEWRQWAWKELATVADEDPVPQPLKDLLAEKLTRWYGGFQGRAGATVGIAAGDAWRVRIGSLHDFSTSVLFAVGLDVQGLPARDEHWPNYWKPISSQLVCSALVQTLSSLSDSRAIILVWARQMLQTLGLLAGST